MHQKVVHLVVDAGAFIKNSPIHDYAENMYSVDGVVKEIKDKVTRQRLEFLPYKLLMKDPEPENYKYVLEFSKKTGDYCNLSVTDLKIIALTYQLEKELVGTDHLNKEPTSQITSTQQAGQKQLEGFYCPEDDEEDDENLDSFENEVEDIITDSFEADNEFPDIKLISNTSENDILDEDSWITPSNLAEVQKRMGNLEMDPANAVTVACVTTDFAIQNVLLQLGLHVVSVDGMLIKTVKIFILRCHACFKTTTDMTKKFCPNCGNSSLKRVCVTVDQNGSKQIQINFRRPINIRGTKFSLPKPRGGKHAKNPILCSDQPVPQNKPAKAAMHKVDVFSPDYVAFQSPFAVHDLYSRAAGLGIYRLNQHRGRKNPNECSKRTGNKNKKRS